MKRLSRSPEQTPTSPQEQSPPVRGPRTGIRRVLSSTVILVGIIACTLLTAILIAGTGGVIAGQKERDVRATQTVMADLDEQFLLGVSNLEQGRYELAAQRFRWILDHDPDYPGVTEHLAEAEQQLSQTGVSPDSQPTLPPSEASNPEELFTEAQTYYEDEQWQNAITRLRELEALDSTFRTIEVQEMLHESLKSLGITYIRGDRLEEGLFLLEQAAVIQPLDDQTEGERRLATLYMTGRSYWNLNWPVVIDNLRIVYDIAPNYRDVSPLLWGAYINYGDLLVELDAQCEAAEMYLSALELEEDAAVREKYDAASSACTQPATAPTATLLFTPESSPDPGSTSTPGPTSVPGVGPSPTSVPGNIP